MFRVRTLVIAAAILGCLVLRVAAAADFTGSYFVDDGEGFIAVVLEMDDDGTVRGMLNDDGDNYRVIAQPVENQIMGAIIDDNSGEQYPILAQLADGGGVLYMRVYTDVDSQGNVVEESGETFEFIRNDMSQAQSGSLGAAPPPTQNPYAPQQQENPYAPQQQSQNPNAVQQQNNPYAPQQQPSAAPQQQNNPYAPQQQSAPGGFGGVAGNGGESQLQQFVSGRHILIAYRDGGALYGTYRYFDIHHCRSGQYVEYGYTSKNSVTGSALTTNWESYGRWQITTQQGRTGVYYQPNNDQAEFVPMQINADGSVFVNEGVNLSSEGQAECQ